MSRLPFSSIRKVGVIMSDNACKNKVQAGKSPLEQGKKTIFDLYEEHKKLLDTLSFISSANINYNADYHLILRNIRYFEDKVKYLAIFQNLDLHFDFYI